MAPIFYGLWFRLTCRETTRKFRNEHGESPTFEDFCDAFLKGVCGMTYGRPHHTFLLVGGLEHDWMIFPFLYGIIRNPLTNSYFSRWLKPPTSNGWVWGIITPMFITCFNECNLPNRCGSPKHTNENCCSKYIVDLPAFLFP